MRFIWYSISNLNQAHSTFQTAIHKILLHMKWRLRIQMSPFRQCIISSFFSAPFTTLCCHFWHFPHIHFQHFIYSSIQKNVYSHYCEFIIDVVDTNICIKITCILWEILYFILRTECPPYLKHFHFIFGEWIRNVIRVTPFHLFTSTICFARSWLTLPTPFVMDGRLIL